MNTLEQIKLQAEQARAELRIFESLPAAVQKMNFNIVSPGKDPFLSFKSGSFDELRELVALFPPVPMLWDTARKTYLTGENENTVVLASPFVVKFDKKEYPYLGRVTVVWNTGGLAVWYNMNASDYEGVTGIIAAQDVHRKQEYESCGNYKTIPMAHTPYLLGCSKTGYWGNHITSYCMPGEYSERYERAVLTGSFDPIC